MYSVENFSRHNYTDYFEEMQQLYNVDEFNCARLMLQSETVHQLKCKNSSTIIYVKDFYGSGAGGAKSTAQPRSSNAINQNVMEIINDNGLELECPSTVSPKSWTKLVRDTAIIITIREESENKSVQVQ